MMSFFGAGKDASGNYFFNNEERLPANWYNRKTSYSNGVTEEIVAMYLVSVSHKLVPCHGLLLIIPQPKPFGGNVGAGNFLGLNCKSIQVHLGQSHSNTSQSEATSRTAQSIPTPFPMLSALLTSSLVPHPASSETCSIFPSTSSTRSPRTLLLSCRTWDAQSTQTTVALSQVPSRLSVTRAYLHFDISENAKPSWSFKRSFAFLHCCVGVTVREIIKIDPCKFSGDIDM